MSGTVLTSRPVSLLQPAVAPRLVYRLSIPGVALLSYGGLAGLWFWWSHPLYFGVLRLFGFRPFRFPFLDIEAVLAAVQCRRYGIDVYQWNPCDVLGRTHVYSPLWLRITPEFLDSDATTAVGLCLGLLFIVSLAEICRPTTRGEVAILGLAALSPVTVYALERANCDLIVFMLVLGGGALARASRPWRLGAYALYLFSGMLKYYPLLLLVLIFRERQRDAIALTATAATVVLLLVLCDGAELATALSNIPSLSHFADSFSATNLPFGLAEALCDGFGRLLIVVPLSGALLALAATRTGRTIHLLDREALDWTGGEMQRLAIGAILITACFFSSQNVNYRGIYFLLALPGLVRLQRSAGGASIRQFCQRMIAAVIFVMWEGSFRSAVHTIAGNSHGGGLNSRAEVFFWLGRELVWWWLITGLASLSLCYLRQLPLARDALTRFRIRL
ncbi:MAG TPA: hypothetical protein VHU84_14480 [Lacipirellulaceae bacterium]|nr:hypothetical protein [Lacipirellulaceae bacterium]